MLGHEISPFLKKLFLDLYRVAIVDGFLKPEELRTLYKIGEERGVSIEEIQEIIRNPVGVTKLFSERDDKEQYLIDITKIIISDGFIRDEEIYLWERIAKTIFSDPINIEVIKEEIFSTVINEYISDEKKRIDNIKKLLNNELNDILNHSLPKTKTKVTQENSKMKVNLIQKKHDYNISRIIDSRFFFYGVTTLKKVVIKDTFIKVFSDYGLEINPKNFSFAISNDYGKLKKKYKTLIEKASKGYFDFLVYGEHPHSITGSSSQNSWEHKLKNRKTLVIGNHHKEITKAMVKEYAEYFANSIIENGFSSNKQKSMTA